MAVAGTGLSPQPQLTKKNRGGTPRVTLYVGFINYHVEGRVGRVSEGAVRGGVVVCVCVLCCVRT